MFATDNWVVIEQEMHEKSSGGIIIPNKSIEKNAPARGKVYLCGDKCKYVKQGQEVMFRREEALKDVIGDTKLIFVREPDVLVVLNDSDGN